MVEDKDVSPGPRQERRHGALLKALTERIVEVYSNCSNEYTYSTNSNPKRTLTWPCEGVHNGGLDNAEHNYICHVGDQITNQEAAKTYEILESLGQGSFGQVLKCQVADSCVALKISKNRQAYFNQGCFEANILKRLNSSFDSNDTQHIVRMLDCFVFQKHLCIAFELLDMTLLEFLKWNNYKGVALVTIQSITRQLLEALMCLKDASLIHCDLKPENVMVCSMSPMRIKLIDFGSACTEKSMLHTYIQSRFYRSPEVILGLPYSSAIDLWSLGCISAELLLGLPLFPGQCEYDQLRCITKIVGLPPKDMLATGSKSKRFFKRIDAAPVVEATVDDKDTALTGDSLDAVTVESGKSHASSTTAASSRDGERKEDDEDAPVETVAHKESGTEGTVVQEVSGRVKSYWRLKTGEEYENDSNRKVRSRRSWNFTSVEDIVKDAPEASRDCFLQFLVGLFHMDPAERWTAHQALLHAFVNDQVQLSQPLSCSPLPNDAQGRLSGSPCSSCPGRGPRHAPSSTGTPGSSPNVGSTSAASVFSAMPSGATSIQQVPSPWHLPSPGSASDGGSNATRSASDSMTSGGDRTSRVSDSDSASASAGSREGLRRREPKFWKQMLMRSEAVGANVPTFDFREAVGLREGPVVVDPRCRPEESFLDNGWQPKGQGYGRRSRRHRKQGK